MNECNNKSASASAPDTERPSYRQQRHVGVWALPDPVLSDDPYGDAVDRAWEEIRERDN